MLDEATLEQGRRVFEEVLRNTQYAPAEPVVIAGQMRGPEGPVICGYWRVFPDGTFERVTAEEATAE